MDNSNVDDMYHNTKRKLDEEVDTAEVVCGSIKRSKPHALESERAESCERSPEDHPSSDNEGRGLLHLSDDVLLQIFRHCRPSDLRALSYSCRRLGVVCSDRSLWRRVDLRGRRLGAAALATFIRDIPRRATLSLCIRGLVGRPVKEDPVAKDPSSSDAGRSQQDLFECGPHRSASDGSLSGGRFGYAPQHRTVKKPKPDAQGPAADACSLTASCNDLSVPGTSRGEAQISNRNESQKTDCESKKDSPTSPTGSSFLHPSEYSSRENGNSSPKPFSPPHPAPGDGGGGGAPSTSSLQERQDRQEQAAPEDSDSGEWTFTKDIMTAIRKKCPGLKELRIEYCYIDCNVIQPSVLPATLETLSLRGSVCRNVPLSRSYLFRIQDYCPLLSELDLSRCAWLSSHSLMVLSKVPQLKRLSLRHCWGLGECVAYASLSARYGFKELEVLDIRGTPMSDSEVSAFSLIHTLRELYLQAANPPSLTATVEGHGELEGDGEHPLDDLNDEGNLYPWELENPHANGNIEEDGYNWSDCEEPKDEAASGEDGRTQNVQGGEDDPQLQLGGNPVEQAMADMMGDPNAPDFQLMDGMPGGAMGRVHVIYVDVRRARNNVVRVRYAPGAPQQAVVVEHEGEAGEDAEGDQDEGVEIRMGNGDNNEDGEDLNRVPDLEIRMGHDEGDGAVGGEQMGGFEIRMERNCVGGPLDAPQRDNAGGEGGAEGAPGGERGPAEGGAPAPAGVGAQGAEARGNQPEVDGNRRDFRRQLNVRLRFHNMEEVGNQGQQQQRAGAAFMVLPGEVMARAMGENPLLPPELLAERDRRDLAVGPRLERMRVAIDQMEAEIGSRVIDRQMPRDHPLVREYRFQVCEYYRLLIENSPPEEEGQHHTAMMDRLRTVYGRGFLEDDDDEADPDQPPPPRPPSLRPRRPQPPPPQQPEQQRPPEQPPRQRPQEAPEVRNINIEIHQHNVVHVAAEVDDMQRRMVEELRALNRLLDERLRELRQRAAALDNEAVNREILYIQRRAMDRMRGDAQPPDRYRIEGPYVFRNGQDIRVDGPYLVHNLGGPDVVGEAAAGGERRRRRCVLRLPLEVNLRQGGGGPAGAGHVEAASLVTDASLLRFGVSDNVVHIGAPNNLPRTTRLRTLVCRGYSRVTDRSLSHLAAAAPELTHLDLSHTSVTRQGASSFRSTRPDCTLVCEHLPPE